jgi:hypothetical protein
MGAVQGGTKQHANNQYTRLGNQSQQFSVLRIFAIG